MFAQGVSPGSLPGASTRRALPDLTAGSGRTPPSAARRSAAPASLTTKLYIGELVWIRCSYVKDPRTGKRVARPNPVSQWERMAVPDLRIISDELWQAVKQRQETDDLRDGP